MDRSPVKIIMMLTLLILANIRFSCAKTIKHVSASADTDESKNQASSGADGESGVPTIRLGAPLPRYKATQRCRLSSVARLSVLLVSHEVCSITTRCTLPLTIPC